MTGPQTFPKLTEEALEAHRQIHFYLDQIERAVTELDPAAADAETLMTIAARISSLKERIEEHVKDEEDGGLYQGIMDALPQAESDVMRLMAQHERIVQSLEFAHAAARTKEPTAARRLKTELEALVALMREHEAEEEALIARALERGSGT